MDNKRNAARRIVGALAAAGLAALVLAGPGRAEVPPPSQTVSAAVKSPTLNRVETLLKQVKAQVAPDERVSVFEVRASQQGDVVTLSGRVLTLAQKEAVARAVQPGGGINEIHDEIAYFPYPEVGPHPYALARYPVVHLRAVGKNSAELSTEVLLGAPLRVLGLQGDWARVQGVDDGYIGWAPKHNLVWLDEKGYQDWTGSRRLLITAHRATLLDGPTAGAQAIGYALAGTELKYLGAAGGFHQVELPSHASAYLRAQDAKPGDQVTPERDPQRILATARSFLGVPYLWGGTSALMFDCSGFSQVVYRLHGYSLPRDADQQQAATQPVTTIAQLQAGDLVFFDKANHMGIYLGEGKVIHCSSSKGGVVINSLDPQSPLYDAWMHDNFAGGGRVISKD